MSIDFYYKPEGNKKITKDFLIEELSDEYNIVNLEVEKGDFVTYFAVNPKNDKKIIYKEKGYEFHLQGDGRYWHPILTRDDDKFDIENSVLIDISVSLDIELEID